MQSEDNTIIICASEIINDFYMQLMRRWMSNEYAHAFIAANIETKKNG